MSTQPQPLIIVDECYHGYESLQDWDRDMSEALDPDFNAEAAAAIPNEFAGTIRVIITYTPEK